MKKGSIAVIAVIVIIQFFRIDKSNPASDPNQGIIIVENVPENVGNILKTSCYDCHSNQVTYPWYTNVAPVGWWVKHHINEGRDELNFSEWGNYSTKRKLHKLKEIKKEVGEAEMPLTSYLLIHGEAKLNKGQQEAIMSWAEELRTGEKKEEL